MQKNLIYLGIMLGAGLLLAGCSLLPPNHETVQMENNDQNVQNELEELTVDEQPATQAPTQPVSAPTSTRSNSTDLPSLESDLGTLTLEEERFE